MDIKSGKVGRRYTFELSFKLYEEASYNHGTIISTEIIMTDIVNSGINDM